MMKSIEVDDAGSCLNKALEWEHVFVLLERDQVAPKVIRYWRTCRIEAGLNAEGDAQMVEAEHLAAVMEGGRESIRKDVQKLKLIDGTVKGVSE